jgi:hypothetical protein
LQLVPDGQNSRVDIELDITVAIPLFGGAAEGMVADQLQAVVARQAEIGNTWLANH